MKLIVDLEDVWGSDDYKVGELIKDIVISEIKAFVRGEVKKALKEHQKEMQAAVSKAVKKDWRLAYELLDTVASKQ